MNPNLNSPLRRCFTALLAVCTFLASQADGGTFSSSTTAPAVNATDIANLAAQTGTDK